MKSVRQTLEETLKKYKGTVLVISHDRYFLNAVCDCMAELTMTHLTQYNGNYDAFMQQRTMNIERQLKEYNLQQKEIARLEAYIELQHRWNRERNIIAAESRQKQLDKMEKLERPEDLPERIRMRFRSPGESGNDVLRAIRLGKRYPGRPLFRDVNFLIGKKERVFLTGQNGCGKSTLIKLLAGRDEPDVGEVEFGYNVEIGYYDQENQQLDEKNTVLDEVWDKYGRMTETEVRSALALFQFRGDDVFKKVGNLSGGEKARLALLTLMLTRCNLLPDSPVMHLPTTLCRAYRLCAVHADGTQHVLADEHNNLFRLQKITCAETDVVAVTLTMTESHDGEQMRLFTMEVR